MYYPEGTVLLDTRIRYGRISFEGRDVRIWDQTWKPSEKVTQDIARDWGSIPVANVQFVSLGSDGVTYTVSKVPPRPSWKSTGAFLTFLCVAGLVIYGIWRLALVYNRPRMPDQQGQH